jgi:hypothetical protein
MRAATATVVAPVTPACAENPCAETQVPICSILPVLPDLDHDVDLSQDLSFADVLPQAP